MLCSSGVGTGRLQNMTFALRCCHDACTGTAALANVGAGKEAHAHRSSTARRERRALIAAEAATEAAAQRNAVAFSILLWGCHGLVHLHRAADC